MSACRTCGAPVLWVTTFHGNPMPLDAEPSDKGNIVLRDGVAHYEGKATLFDSAPRYISHFATCKDAVLHRKKR